MPPEAGALAPMFPVLLSWANLTPTECAHIVCLNKCLPKKSILSFWTIKSDVDYWPLGNHLPWSCALSPLIFLLHKLQVTPRLLPFSTQMLMSLGSSSPSLTYLPSLGPQIQLHIGHVLAADSRLCVSKWNLAISYFKFHLLLFLGNCLKSSSNFILITGK